MTERRIKPSFSFQRTINAHKEGHKLIIRGGDVAHTLRTQQTEFFQKRDGLKAVPLII